MRAHWDAKRRDRRFTWFVAKTFNLLRSYMYLIYVSLPIFPKQAHIYKCLTLKLLRCCPYLISWSVWPPWVRLGPNLGPRGSHKVAVGYPPHVQSKQHIKGGVMGDAGDEVGGGVEWVLDWFIYICWSLFGFDYKHYLSNSPWTKNDGIANWQRIHTNGKLQSKVLWTFC